MAKNQALVYTTLVAIGAVGAVILANKVREKILAAQITQYNIDLLKQKKESLSKDKIAEARKKVITAATKLQEALEEKITLQKKYQAKIDEAKKNGTPIGKLELEYATELAKVEKKVNDAQQVYNAAQYEALSLQQQSLEVSNDLRSSLSSVPGII